MKRGKRMTKDQVMKMKRMKSEVSMKWGKKNDDEGVRNQKEKRMAKNQRNGEI